MGTLGRWTSKSTPSSRGPSASARPTPTATGSQTSSGTPWPRGASTPRSTPSASSRSTARRPSPSWSRWCRTCPPPPCGRSGPGAAAYAVADDPDAPVTAENLVAVFSSSTRKGRWRIGRRTNAFSLFGNVEIDLTEALFEQRLTVINATAILGNVEVRVPENVTLRGSGTGIFGNFEVDTLESENPEAPVVVVNGYSVFGNIEAKPKRGKLVADLRTMVDKKLRKHLG